MTHALAVCGGILVGFLLAVFLRPRAIPFSHENCEARLHRVTATMRAQLHAKEAEIQRLVRGQV